MKKIIGLALLYYVYQRQQQQPQPTTPPPRPPKLLPAATEPINAEFEIIEDGQ